MSAHQEPRPNQPAEEPIDVDDVEAVTTAMLTASRLLVAISARSLAAVEDTVTLPQFRLLVVLSTQGPAKLVTLARLLGVNPSTALRMVDRLTAAGLVHRQASPHSGREISLTLTTAGHTLVNDVTTRRRHELAAVIRAMPATQRRDLLTALRAFTDAGGEPTAHPPTPLGWT